MRVLRRTLSSYIYAGMHGVWVFLETLVLVWLLLSLTMEMGEWQRLDFKLAAPVQNRTECTLSIVSDDYYFYLESTGFTLVISPVD